MCSEYIYVVCPFVILQTRSNSDVPFTGLTKAETLTEWAKELCVPLVRELTFENAEVTSFICLAWCNAVSDASSSELPSLLKLPPHLLLIVLIGKLRFVISKWLYFSSGRSL